MRVGKIAGVTIRLSPWFILILGVFSIAGLLTKALVVFLSVLWHEVAHALAARLLGYHVREVELLPFGGVARIERLSEADAKNDIFIALTGPVASFVLAGLIQIASGYFADWEANFYYQTNLMLGWFNLIPALPLDGGRILRAWLSELCGHQKATQVTVFLGWVLSILFFLITALQFYFHSDIHLTLLFVAVFIAICAQRELEAASYRAMRVLARKKADLMQRGVMPTAHFTTVADCSVRDVIALFRPEQYHIVLVVDQMFQLRGTLSESQLWEELPNRGVSAKIGDFLY